jgi:carbamoyltransferase
MLLAVPVLEKHRVALSAGDRGKMADHPDLSQRVNVVRSTLPAITHVDYSARVQTVDARRNSRFHHLIRAFARLTGCPMIVNTSFNVRGEPLVCTPDDAYRCFLNTGLDVLVLENFILQKEKLRKPATTEERQQHVAQFQLD